MENAPPVFIFEGLLILTELSEGNIMVYKISNAEEYIKINFL